MPQREDVLQIGYLDTETNETIKEFKLYFNRFDFGVI